jgi:hypothetical protein
MPPRDPRVGAARRCDSSFITVPAAEDPGPQQHQEHASTP